MEAEECYWELASDSGRKLLYIHLQKMLISIRCGSMFFVTAIENPGACEEGIPLGQMAALAEF